MTEIIRRTYPLLPTSLVFALHRKNVIAELQAMTGQKTLSIDQYDAVADAALSALIVLRQRGVLA